MSSSLFESAKRLAAMGFYVFPLKEGKKLPAVRDFTEVAVNDPDDVKKFWYDSILGFEHPFNIGIATTRFQDGGLLVVDVDNKRDKTGSATVMGLELQNFIFPKTLTQKTPSGGYHYIYKVKEAIKQTTNLYPGIDTRSKGGLIVGAGSIIAGKAYTIDDTPIAQAPEWLVKKCEERATTERKSDPAKKPAKKISQKGAVSRGRDYLLNQAQTAVEGAGGDHTTFAVASRLKDFGVSQDNALALMLDNWNDNCQPPWAADQLKLKIGNAYAYGQNKQGVDSPESDFDPIPQSTGDESGESDGQDSDESLEAVDPVSELNREFSFIVMGGKSTVLRESLSGETSYMSVQAFHDLLKARTIQTGNGRKKQLSELWLASPNRSTYDRAELVPGKKAPPGVYNLWRGFSCKPLAENETPTPDMLEGVRLFREHALQNVCRGEKELFDWLFGYFAHLIQKPWEKPLTALVFKGQKGVGKNALIDRIGSLFNGHYLLTSNRRYLTSNFNKHLANLILFVLDEAIWSGDKQAEGILKDLITGHTHLIEHKGREMFAAKNCIRLVIIGNEEWVVPATEDERRFAVFNVGSERKRDKKFFVQMRELLDDKDGNRLLLRELLSFDLASMDVDEAPETVGLLEQKLESLNPIHSWWYSSLREGTILSLDFTDEVWPSRVGRQSLREAFLVYSRARGIRSWLPDASVFGRHFSKACPGARSQRAGGRDSRLRAYTMPNLAECREQFDLFIGHTLEWEPEDSNTNNAIDAAELFS